MTDDLDATLDALAEAVLPGAARAGAPAVLGEVLGRMGAEAEAGVVMALDAFAATVRPDIPFRDLDPEERVRVLREIAAQEEPQLQQLVRLSVSLVVAAVYGELSGLDDAGRLVRRPQSWDEIGYPGPSTGYELRPATGLTGG